MQRLVVLLLVLAAAAVTEGKKEKDVTSLQIGVKFRPKECAKRSKVGDTLKVGTYYAHCVCASLYATDALHWQAH